MYSCPNAWPSGCWRSAAAEYAAWNVYAATARANALAARRLILACNGYGGNPELVRRFIPEMADALYFGHPGNRGDAVLWGDALGAQLAHLGAYQGHGSVATPHNILITWAAIMQGGIQVNSEGRRFCDESRGYSEQATDVLRQPGGIALDVFDARIATVARQFEDFRAAEKAGAILTAGSVAELAAAMRVPAAAFAAEWADAENLKATNGTDRFGRQFTAATALRAAISRGQGHRRAVPHPRRSCDRCQRPRQAQGWLIVCQICSQPAARRPAYRARRRRAICRATVS